MFYASFVMASILDEYEDSQNTRKSAQRHSRLSNTNIGIPHTGEPPSSSHEPVSDLDNSFPLSTLPLF